MEKSIVFENPGSVRTGTGQMLKGGISDPRNNALMKMFNLICIGERVVSGVPNIHDIWNNEGWGNPTVEEEYGPDRTRLTLPLLGTTLGVNDTQGTPKLHPNGDEIDDKILLLLKEQPTLSQSGIAKVLNVNVNNIKSCVSKLKKLNLLVREGTSQKGTWIVKAVQELE